jgi:phosphatidylinositol-3-phosphatase
MRSRLVLPGLAACLLAASPVLAGQASAATVPSFGHVFVIVGENKSLFQINSSNAPYIMKTLKPQGAWFTDYNDAAKGSLADYVALTSGQYAPCQVHGPCGVFNVPSIFSQLGNGNWQDWNESMPSNCYRSDAGALATLNAYQTGHNPAPYYAGLPCSTYDVPAGTTGPDDMSYFNDALAAGSVPEYNFITPNNCEDGHNSCDNVNTVTEYDNFLKKEIPLIEASPAFGSTGVIFVTFDEGYRPTSDTNTMMLVIGPQVQAGTYSGYFDHYSTVATVEQGLGLPCLANACTASTLTAFGGGTLSPSASITQPTDGRTVFRTITVAGTATAQGSVSASQNFLADCLSLQVP